MDVFVFFVLIWVLNTYSNLFLDSSRLYSSSIAHRLQTDALLDGKLSLSPRPFGYKLDYIWLGKGTQQCWGLGVPFMRLPFEWIGRLCGLSCFPDRLILLFYLTLMILALNVSLGMIFLRLKLLEKTGFYIRWGITAWILFCPSFGGLLRRPLVYDETVLYGCMCAFILLSLFWVYMIKLQSRLFFIICLASGLVWLVRLTLIEYGAVTFILACGYNFLYRRDLRQIGYGLLCFCVGPFLVLWFNALRFGSIFEFGYAGNQSTSAGIIYTQRFINPFQHEPFISSFKELFGALFFHGLWQSHTYRWRWYYFRCFNVSHLVLLGLAAALVVLILYSPKVRHSFRENTETNLLRLIYFSLLWGYCSGIFLGFFYLYTPALECRYLSDFVPAFGAIFIAALLLCFQGLIISKIKNAAAVVLAGILVVSCFNDLGFFRGFKKNARSMLATRQEIEQRVKAFNRGIAYDPDRPESVSCGQSYPYSGMWGQFLGWEQKKDCSVHAATTFILPSKKCLDLEYIVNDGALKPDVRVRRDLDYLKSAGHQDLVADASKQGRVKVAQEFCSEFPSVNEWSLYTIAWVSADQVSDKKFPVLLKRVRVR